MKNILNFQKFLNESVSQIQIANDIVRVYTNSAEEANEFRKNLAEENYEESDLGDTVSAIIGAMQHSGMSEVPEDEIEELIQKYFP